MSSHVYSYHFAIYFVPILESAEGGGVYEQRPLGWTGQYRVAEALESFKSDVFAWLASGIVSPVHLAADLADDPETMFGDAATEKAENLGSSSMYDRRRNLY